MLWFIPSRQNLFKVKKITFNKSCSNAILMTLNRFLFLLVDINTRTRNNFYKKNEYVSNNHWEWRVANQRCCIGLIALFQGNYSTQPTNIAKI